MLVSSRGSKLRASLVAQRANASPPPPRTECKVSSFDQAYFMRHAALERQAARRARDPQTRLLHEDAARVYEALAANAAPSREHKTGSTD